MSNLIAHRGIEPWRRRLYLPAYRVSEAARYCKTHPQAVAYWHYRGGGLGPVLPGSERGKPLSYMELVEVAIVAVFRQFGVSLQRIRRARQYAAQRFQVDFPFVQLSFKTEGHHMLLEYLAEENDPQLRQVIVADSAGQLAWETLMADKFAEFDYEHGLALIWHVAGRESPISIDPRIAFGAPTVRGIPTWVIKGRWDAGESFEDIEDDFGVPRDDVVSALRFEGIQEAA